MRTIRQSTLMWPGAAVQIKMLVALLALLFSTAFLPMLHAENGEEPTYKGKPLSYWLDDYADLAREIILGVNPTLKEEQTNALLHMGTNAVPWLIKRLSTPQPLDCTTIPAFRVLGPLASSAIPALVRLATNQPECVT